MRRETQNVVLLLVGGGLLKIALNGSYLRYVKPAQFPWLLSAGVVLVGLAAVAIGRDIRSGVASAGHDHGGRSSWLLVLPVLAIFLIAPPALGADSVDRSAPRQPVARQSIPPLPPGVVLPMRLSDFVTRAGWDATHALRGREVELTGFIDRAGGRIRLVRMVITCCAADASPMTVRLTDVPGNPSSDQWVIVHGKLVDGAGEQYTPLLRVSSLIPIAAPREPYEL